jgi:hypothetical protein
VPLRFVPLVFIGLGVLCVLIAALLPVSRRKAKVRLLASLAVGLGFCLESVSVTLPPSEPRWHLALLFGFGIFLVYCGILKFRRDPLGQRPARSL